MSGIYIPGMAMPKNCFLCPLSYMRNERLFCFVTKEEVLRAKIATECPIVHVPPHGDLIDRETTRGKIGHLADEIDNKLGYEKSAPYIMMTLYLNNVDDFPTIIPADKEGEG